MKKIDIVELWGNFIWLIFIVVAPVYLFTGLVFEMPYYSWLYERLPTWLAVLNIVIMGVAFAMLGIPMRSTKVNYFAGFIFFLTGAIYIPCVRKVPFIGIATIVLSAFIFVLLKWHFKQKNKINEDKNK